MLRLAPPGFLRSPRRDPLTSSTEVARPTWPCRWPTLACRWISNASARPQIGEACLQFLRQYGVGTAKIVRGGDRLGIYYMEMGAVQRPARSSTTAPFGHCHDQAGHGGLKAVFADADWFHWTGITPAISQARLSMPGGGAGRSGDGLTVSADLNYRATCGNGARRRPRSCRAVALCDIAVGNEEDADKVFGIRAPTRT